MGKDKAKARSFTGLNRPGIIFIRDHFLKGKIVEKAFKLKKKKGKFRILDIGCGDFPYLKENDSSCNENILSVFEKSHVEIQLIDIDKPKIPESWRKFTKGIKGCFYDYYKNFDDEKFDLIILSAVAHELYLKWCISRISNVQGQVKELGQVVVKGIGRTKFCEDLFKKLYSLVDEGGLVFFAENYTPKRISRESQLKAREVQLKITSNHADSPSAFFPTEEYVEAAEKVGFKCVEQDSVRCISSEKYDNCDEEIKSALKARRFGCKLLRKERNENESNTNNSNSLRRGFVFDISEEGNLKEVDDALKGWIENSKENILDTYAQVFWGEKGIFKHLVKRSFEVVSSFFEYEDISDPELFSCWVSINSLVVNDRVCPKDTTNNTFTPILRKSDGVEVYLRNNKSEKDWNEIAFNFLSSNEAFKTLFKDCSGDFFKESRGPSVYNYIKSNTSIRSLTITYARESHYEDPAINLSMQEDAINALDLEVLQEKTAKGNNAKHRLIVLNFPVNNSDNEVNSYLNVAAHINQLLGGSYYLDVKGKDYIKYLTAIYLDFLFLRRFETRGKKFAETLEEFGERWMKCIGEESSNGDVVYENLHKILDSVVNVASNKSFSFTDLPRAFITYSSPSYWHTDENSISDLRKQSPGSLMIFSDKIFPKDVLDSMVAVTERTFDVVRAIELKWVEEKQRQNLEKANIKSAVGSIMSRNGSHNIGSHVLAALSHNVGTLPDDRVLYQYIQQRMDYIATVTTDFPTWTQPTMFVADMMKTFLSQRHLLDHIVESEGLHAFQFQNPNMTDNEWLRQENCVRIHIRKKVDDEYIEFVKYDLSDGRTKTIDLKEDVELAIPGGIIGEHAFYTILENVIRNAAKHSWAKIKQWQIRQNEIELQYNNLELFIDFEEKDDEVKFNVYAKLPMAQVVVEKSNADNELCQKVIASEQLTKGMEMFDDMGVVKAKEKDNFKNPPDNVQQQIKLHLPNLEDDPLKKWVDRYDKQGGLTSDEQEEFDSLAIHHKQQIMLARPFIDSQGALRRENWGMAEMKISAGYLVGESIEAIGGIGDKKGSNEIITPYIKSEKVKRKCIESGKKVTEIEVEELYLGYEFSIAKPKEILIIVKNENENKWNDKNGVMKKNGIFVKTIEKAKEELQLNYRYIVHYDATEFFDIETREPKDGILIPFRMLSGKKVPEDWSWLQPYVADLDNGIEKDKKENGNGFEQLKKSFENGWVDDVRKIVYKAYYEHLRKSRNEDEIKEIGLLVAINENEKSGGNSLISDSDILELMLEQNFAVCVEQYKAFAANEDNRKIIKCLESIRHKSSAKDKVIKFKHFSNKTIRELIAQRMCDWAEKSNDSWSSIVEHLRKKYFVSDAKSETPNELKPSSNKTSDDFEANVNSLLQKHPIDDFIRYVESIFENTKKLFKQYEEQIVTLPAGYKVDTRNSDGDSENESSSLEFKIKYKAFDVENDTDGLSWIAYRRHDCSLSVNNKSKVEYVEPLSGTQTYLSQLTKVKDNLGLQMRLIESGLMRILVLDERVAKFLREHQKEVGPHYKAMNINVIDDKLVEGNVLDKEGFFTGYTRELTKDLKEFAKKAIENKGVKDIYIGGQKKKDKKDKIKMEDEIKEKFANIDILIVHQGILDKWFSDLKSVEGMKYLLEGFKKLVKYVVVTTGRGTPVNIPKEAHLLPFAVVESTLFKKYPEKLILTDTIMNVLPVGAKANEGGE